MNKKKRLMQDLVDKMNIGTARLAHKAAEKFTQENSSKPRLVVGFIGPSDKMASIWSDVNDPRYRAISFVEIKKAYKQQTHRLIKGGVDTLLVDPDIHKFHISHRGISI